MTIDPDNLADIAIDAAFDDYEGTGIFTRDRAKAAARKALKSHVDKLTPSYGGFGVGAFAAVGDGVHVYREYQPITETVVRIALNEKSRKWFGIDPPLLPDGD